MLRGLNILSRWRSLRRDEGGAIFIIVALAIPVLFGAAAASVDVGQLLYIQAELRSAADAAALAATDELDDEDAAKALAVRYGESNMPTAQNGDVIDPDDVIIGNWDTNTNTFTAAGTPTNAVKVTARRSSDNGNPVSLYFARMVGFDTSDVEVISVASVSQSDDNFCILSLSEAGAGAVTLNGGPELIMPNCGLAVSSSSDTALTVNGSGTLTASEICVSGGSFVVGAITINPGVTDDCSNIPDDPLSELEEPDVRDCDFENFRISGSNQTIELDPGVYCDGITVNGNNNTLIMASGDYIMNGGGIRMTGGTLRDDGLGGVFIFNTGDADHDAADISFTGTTAVSLTAQTTGTYAGILFFSDSDNGDDGDIDVNGSGDTAFTGALYAPASEISYNGNSSQSSSCVQIIANTVTLSGTSETFDPDDCDDSAVVIATTTPPRLRD